MSDYGRALKIFKESLKIEKKRKDKYDLNLFGQLMIWLLPMPIWVTIKNQFNMK